MTNGALGTSVYPCTMRKEKAVERMPSETSNHVVEISVIIPVYNMKPYLDECVQSVLAQTFSDYEVLLIDDGSTDGSDAICDGYAERYSNVSVIHQANQGPGPARNMGMKHARGKYLSFVDADDTVEKDMLQAMHDAVIRYDAQIAMCGRSCLYPDGKVIMLFTREKPEVITGEEALKRLLLYQDMDSSACDKLFLASTLQDLSFPAGLIAEDIAVVYLALARVDRLVHIGAAKYNNRWRAGSRSRSSYTAKTKGMLFYSQEARSFCIAHYPQYRKEADAFFCNNVGEAAYMYYHTAAPKEDRALMRAFVRQAYGCSIHNPWLTRERKQDLALQRFHLYPLVWRLRRIRHRVGSCKLVKPVRDIVKSAMLTRRPKA